MPIRPMRREDHALAAAMRYDFRAELVEPSEPRDAFVARMTTWLDRHLPPASSPRDLAPGTAPAWQGWLATDETGDEAIGHVFLHLVEKVPNPLPEAELIGYVTNLYVVPPRRGQGIGAALLDRATRECRDLGCDSAVLWPSPRSVPLYERHGYRRPARVMELELGGRPVDDVAHLGR